MPIAMLVLPLVGVVWMTAEAVAQDGRRQIPRELIGKYAESPEGCRSYHRKLDGLITITADREYVFGSGSGTWATINSVRKTGSRYIFRLTSPNNPAGRSVTWNRVADNVYEEVMPPLPNGRRDAPTALVRCSERDAIAGIGLQALDGAATSAPTALFTAEYAQHVPLQCPRLQIDSRKIETARAAAIETLARFFAANPQVHGGRSPTALAADHAVALRRDAIYALEQDAKEIRAFCDHVLDAFGRDGRVVPELVVDPRRRA